MILCDSSIVDHIAGGCISITPNPDMSVQLQSASIDLRLGKEFARFKRDLKTIGKIADGLGAIDPGVTNVDELMEVFESECHALAPGEFVLATTYERVRLPKNIVARVDGRSSWGRLGLIVHSTAGFIDPGFDGNITLEMTNIGAYPIALRPGLRVCQLVFEKLDGDATPYSGKYQGQTHVTPSRVGSR